MVAPSWLNAGLAGVAHAVQAVPVLPRALDGNERIEALLGRHLVGAGTVLGVQETRALLIIGHQVVQHGVSVFNKAAVLQWDIQLTQRDNDTRILGVLFVAGAVYDTGTEEPAVHREWHPRRHRRESG